MILSDIDLAVALSNGQLVVEPAGPDCVQPASIDLRLGDEFARFEASYPPRVVDPWGVSRSITSSEKFKAERVTIEPQTFMLAHTLERVRLGDNLVARIEGRSTIGRHGLAVHITAGFVDPGFDGQLTLELFNASPHTIILRAGMPIAQLAVQRLSSAAAKPYGHPARRSKYQQQEGAVPARPLNESEDG